MTQSTGKRRQRGTGSVRERIPGVWDVRAPVGGKQVGRTVRGSRRDAEAVLVDLIALVALTQKTPATRR